MESTDYILLFDKFLKKQATIEEVNLLIQWLKNESSFSSWADEQWETVSSDMDSVLQQKLLGQIKVKIRSEKKNIQSSPKSRLHAISLWTLRIASLFLLLLATGTGMYSYMLNTLHIQDMTVSVERGQKANITLPDGSKVWINSDSELSYGARFNSNERVLYLKGEAYFEVSPDKERPFTVQTTELSVTALGTSFDVKSYKDEVHTSAVLMTGKVEVKSGTDCIILEPNEKIVFNKSNGKMIKTNVADAHDYSNWKYNSLSFDAETFENIARTLERYYNTRILFESESLKKYRFTGTPGNTSLESILQILSLTSPLTYEVKDNLIILRENIKEKAYYEKALK